MSDQLLNEILQRLAVMQTDIQKTQADIQKMQIDIQKMQADSFRLDAKMDDGFKKLNSKIDYVRSETHTAFEAAKEVARNERNLKTEIREQLTRIEKMTKDVARNTNKMRVEVDTLDERLELLETHFAQSSETPGMTSEP